MRFRTGNAFLRDSSKHCNFAGDDCWYVRTHPKIESVSAVSGYTTGGQELTISGWGLKGTSLDDVEVLVDGALADSHHRTVALMLRLPCGQLLDALPSLDGLSLRLSLRLDLLSLRSDLGLDVGSWGAALEEPW